MLICECSGERQKKAEMTFTYTWVDSFNDIHSSMLIVEDSLIKFYPWAESTELFAFRTLGQEERDSMDALLAGLSSGNFGGSFSEGNIKVEYAINEKFANEGNAIFNPRRLNHFLLEQIIPYPSEIREGFDILTSVDTIFNEGTWSKLELMVFEPETRKCTKHLTITKDSVVYRNFELNYFEQRKMLSAAEKDSLTENLRRINLSVEYQYWDGTRKGWEMTGCPEAGIGLYLDGKCLAIVHCFHGMPTRQLANLFEFEYRLSPSPLYIYYDCYSGEDLIWDQEDEIDL